MTSPLFEQKHEALKGSDVIRFSGGMVHIMGCDNPDALAQILHSEYLEKLLKKLEIE